MVKTKIAGIADLSHIESLVEMYHEFEGIQSAVETRRETISRLLDPSNTFGFIVIASRGDNPIGYAAICYGFSIEFGGRDSFLDEIFVEKSSRGSGVGGALVKLAVEIAKERKVKALHLEVSRSNEKAEHFYSNLGFKSRKNFNLMSKNL